MTMVRSSMTKRSIANLFPGKTDPKKTVDFKRGCYVCGFQNSALVDNGLTSAHIFANGTVSNLAWNIIPLCPNCHQSFDSIIKPMLANAIEYAWNGFLQNPSDSRTSRKVDLPDLLKALRSSSHAIPKPTATPPPPAQTGRTRS